MILLYEPFVCSLPSAEQGVAPEAVAEAYHAYEQGSKVAPLSAAAVSNQTIQESQRLLLLVRAYQAIFSWSCIPTVCEMLLPGLLITVNAMPKTTWRKDTVVWKCACSLQALDSMDIPQRQREALA